MDLDEQRMSFGSIAHEYDTYRPEWPPRTADWLIGEPAPGVRRRVLDLGAGTGKLTRTLAAAGHDVVAVDPSEGMLEVLRAALPGIETHVAGAERIPSPDASIDAITAVQAWHWFRHDDAVAECARVLRPGGTLGVGWHIRDESVEWVNELEQIAQPGAHAAQRRQDSAFRLPAPFGPIQFTRFEYELRLSVNGLVGLTSSWSYVQLRADRDAVLQQVAELGRRAAGPDGNVTLPYITRCYRAVRS